MLHKYMFRCSPFMQVKCNCYHMGTIALTVKTNNCKTPLPEAAFRLILRKKFLKIQPQIFKGTTLQVPFTRIEFAKEPY